MTHEEAMALLPEYALGALEESADLEAHLVGCPTCAAELASLLETTAALAAAVAPVPLPAALRARVLAHGVARPDAPAAARRRLAVSLDHHRPGGATIVHLPFRRAASGWLAAAAAVLLVLGGFGAGSLAQQRQIEATRAELTLDRQGLALLTSTETANARLAPVPPLGGNAHGHWFHRPSVNTQVLVVESLPAPANGEAYRGWLQRKDGSWIAAGPFALDQTGYGRIILPGGDGSDVAAIEVTRQAGETAAPAGTLVLKGP
jgi:Anti-sigma-K factor rskA